MLRQVQKNKVVRHTLNRFALIAALALTFIASTSHADVSEHKYKLIKAGWQVKCTEWDKDKNCITWNWVKPEHKHKEKKKKK